MKVLITGGAGFIGSTLATRFLAGGHNVTVLDNVLGHARLPSPNQHPGRLHYLGVDIRTYPGLLDYIANTDLVVHLASHVGIRHYIGQTRVTIDTIVLGTERVIDACVAARVPLLMTSTSEAYGKGVRVPMQERDDLRFGATTVPRWVYGMAKALSEHLALDAATHQGLEVRIIRPFNIVGPGQRLDSGLIFPVFADQVRRGVPLTVHGSGLQTRTFCGVDDFVDGLLRLAACPEAAGQVVNLGSDRETTMREVAETFAQTAEESFSRSVQIDHIPYTETYPTGFEDALRRVPDLSRAQALIGWDSDDLTPLPDLVRATLADVLGSVAVPAAD